MKTSFPHFCRKFERFIHCDVFVFLVFFQDLSLRPISICWHSRCLEKIIFLNLKGRCFDLYLLLLSFPIIYLYQLRCICYSGFHHTRLITHCMAFPYPATDSLAPMEYFLSFDVSLIIPKNIRKMIYVAFTPITVYIRRYIPNNRVHRDVCIIQILFIVFLDMDPSHSIPGLPYALRSLGFDPSLSLVKLYKEPLGTLKA